MINGRPHSLPGTRGSILAGLFAIASHLNLPYIEAFVKLFMAIAAFLQFIIVLNRGI
ncbi:hypothetical protein [Nostoc sp.]